MAVDTASGLMFHLEPNQKKCLKEEIHKDVVVKGEYEVYKLLLIKIYIIKQVYILLLVMKEDSCDDPVI